MPRSRYTPIFKAKMRADRAEMYWRQLVGIVEDAAKKRGYTGPTPDHLLRVLGEIELAQAAIDHWCEAVALKARRIRRITPAMRKMAIDEALQLRRQLKNNSSAAIDDIARREFEAAAAELSSLK